MKNVTVLLPTVDRKDSLIFTLSGLANQSFRNFDLVVSDQSSERMDDVPVVRTLVRILESRGANVRWHYGRPKRGIAEQRDFLLSQARTPYVLFLDDDVFMEAPVLERLVRTIEEERCGFVGAFPTGLSFRDDVRPEQQVIEFWNGPVEPENVEPNGFGWDRAELHRAANAWHVALRLTPGEERRYKVAWIASCVLYDREKLLEIGGFSFWRELPRYHSGEDVLAQNLLMRRWGGCAIMPSGTFHAEVPSTVLNGEGTVEGHALALLDSKIEQYVGAVAK